MPYVITDKQELVEVLNNIYTVEFPAYSAAEESNRRLGSEISYGCSLNAQ